MAICVECSHALAGGVFVTCRNSGLSVTDFVYGIRDCKELNPKGNCMGFKPQSENESIYKLPKDEELAKTE